MAVGYTPKQAETRKQLVSKQVAKIEDDIAKLREIEPDCDLNQFMPNFGINEVTDHFREVEHGLHGVIDRRTRGES